MEFAPEYSKKEKIERTLLALLLGILGLIANQKWLMPLWIWFVATAHCHSVGSFSGYELLWQILFVWIPLSSALITGIIIVPLSIKALVQGQFPPIGYKVYKPTRIKRGWRAINIALIYMLPVIAFLAIGAWGSEKAKLMPKESSEKLDYSVCTDNKNIKHADS